MEEDKRENVGAKHREFADNERNEKGTHPETSASSVLDLAFEQSSRQPFTALSQEDSDLALARFLQEQVFVEFYFPLCFIVFIILLAFFAAFMGS